MYRQQGLPQDLQVDPDEIIRAQKKASCIGDATYHGESTVVGIQLLPYDKRAIMLLSTVEGVFAHLVDAEGKSTPLPTKLE